MKLRTVSSKILVKSSRLMPREGDLCYLLTRRISPQEGNWKFRGYRQIIGYDVDTDQNEETLYVEVFHPNEFPGSILHHRIGLSDIKQGIWYSPDRSEVHTYIKVHIAESVDLINQMLSDDYKNKGTILEFRSNN